MEVPETKRKEWIQTFSGVKFFPLEPRHCDIVLDDIAHALSNICRYTGHVQRFYSVAEHSVLVSREVERRTKDLHWRDRRDVARWGLLHDASEAYIADVSRPVKHLPAFQQYREAEARLQRVIAERFGLLEEEPQEVRDVDAEILGSEVAELLPNADLTEWGLAMPGGKMPELLPLLVIGMNPEDAKRSFLHRFYELELWGHP
jgi:uncharacterized protein